MADMFSNDDAVRELEALFSDYMDKADNVVEILQTGADAFVSDLKHLPSPRSKINKAGYTHLIDSFASQQEKDQVLIGWGKYYGPMVEGGTKKMAARPHMKPLWKRNANKYYKIMIDKLNGG